MVVRAELTAESYARAACGWVAGGASIVGGCCGIGPIMMAEVSRALSRQLEQCQPCEPGAA